jgi:DNA polymerase-3 subunit delta'
MEFWRTGRGWFRRTGVKGAVDKHLAMALVLALQREVVHTLRGQPQGPVAQGLLKLTPGRLKRLDLALAPAQAALSLPTPVNPALVLDWLATHVHKAPGAPPA